MNPHPLNLFTSPSGRSGQRALVCSLMLSCISLLCLPALTWAAASSQAGTTLRVKSGGPYVGEPGKRLRLNAQASGGSGTYSYFWDLNRDHVFERRGSRISWTPARSGQYLARVKVVDRRTHRQAQRLFRIVVLRGGTAQTPSATPTPGANPPAIPDVDRWRSQMETYGRTLCTRLLRAEEPFDSLLTATYYDAQWVFLQIADYTGDATWHQCARAARAIYRDRYVIPNQGRVPGYWNFTHGLTLDYLKFGDSVSKSAAIALSHAATFTPDSTPLEWTVSADYSREVAYAIMAYLNSERLGEARRPRLAALVDQALGHLDQWTNAQSAPYVRPFMVGLTAQALISYYAKVPDSRIEASLAQAMDWLWTHTWLPDSSAFRYTDRYVSSSADMDPAPDLNLLIAPAFAWLYHQTGESRFQVRGDQIFSGGVKGAWLINGKQFDQNYRWSFAYVEWRSSSPLK